MKLHHFALMYAIVCGIAMSMLYSVIGSADAAAYEEMHITDTLVQACGISCKWLKNEPEVLTELLTDQMYKDYVRAVSVGLGSEGYSITSAELSKYIPVFAVIADGKMRIDYLGEGNNGSDRCITDIIDVQDTYGLVNEIEKYVENANNIGKLFGLKYFVNIGLNEASEMTSPIDRYAVIGLFQNFPTRVAGYSFNRAVFTGVTTEAVDITKQEGSNAGSTEEQ